MAFIATDFDEVAADAPELGKEVMALIVKDDFDGAIKKAEDAKRSQEAPALRALCRANLAKADMPPAEGAAEAALKAAEDSIAASKKSKSPTGEAAGMVLVAKAKLAAKKDAEALKSAEEAMEKFQGSGNQAGEASALCVLARAYIPAGRNQKAFELATKAVSIFRELGEAKGETMALIALFDIYMAMKKYSDAVQATERMSDLTEGLGDNFSLGVAKLLAAKAHKANDDRVEAVTVAQESTKYLKKVNASRTMAMVNQLGAEAATAECMGDEAVDMSDKAVMYYKQAGDKMGQASAMITMANLYNAMGEFDKAVYRAEAAADSFKKLQAIPDAAAAFRTACQAYLDKKQYDPKAGASVAREAGRTASTSLKLYESVGETESVGYAASVNSLAQSLLGSGDLDQATEKANESQAIFKKLDYTVGIASTMNTLAQVYFKKGDTFEAVSAAREAQSLFQEGDDDQGADFSAYLIDLFQAPPEQEGGEEVVEVKEKKPKAGPSASGLGDLIPGGAAAVKPIAAYDAYEGRAATAPGQRRQASGAAAAGGPAAIVKEEAVFNVRWVAMKNISTSTEGVKSGGSKVIKRGMVSGGPGSLVPSARKFEVPVY